MEDAARHMEFELAAVHRDQLAAIERVREEQRVVVDDDSDRDVLGLYREGERSSWRSSTCGAASSPTWPRSR